MAVEQELRWVRRHAGSLTTARADPRNRLTVGLRCISWGLESGSSESLEAFRLKQRLPNGCPEGTCYSQICCVGCGFLCVLFLFLTRESFLLFLFVLLACAVFLKRRNTCNCFRCVCILWPTRPGSPVPSRRTTCPLYTCVTWSAQGALLCGGPGSMASASWACAWSSHIGE